MKKNNSVSNRELLTRRQFGALGAQGFLLATTTPVMSALELPRKESLRAINIMNFIRAEEPREPMNLMLPVKGQMELIKQYGLPATWLLQYDAMVEGPYAAFLKSQMPGDHETGIWFEMNRKICDDAGIAWRGNPRWEWDYHVPVAYAIGYKPDERRVLVDTAMKTHKRVFGRDAKTVASWNLDDVTVAHLADHWGVDAIGNCRDQLATDGFTIWGAPIAGYYPNRVNAWSPAVENRNQISAPMFRLLGQDPVYYYDKTFPYPDTMEPAWPSGQSEVFVDHFLSMIDYSPTLGFAYAQLGQENSFGWPVMQKAYAMQMHKLAQARKERGLIVETMGATGRRFKDTFKTTPAQAQIMLEDPFGNQSSPERTVWYQSRYYRANLHFRGAEFYLRDLHVYSDRYPELFLKETATTHGIEQRMLAVLDGYHWSDDEARKGGAGRRAMGRFASLGTDGRETVLSMAGVPAVRQRGSLLEVEVALESGGSIVVAFKEREVKLSLRNVTGARRLRVAFEWAAGLSTLADVEAGKVKYSFRDFDYSVAVVNGSASRSINGVQLTSAGEHGLRMVCAQNA
jgi:hypothetical protein